MAGKKRKAALKKRRAKIKRKPRTPKRPPIPPTAGPRRLICPRCDKRHPGTVLPGGVTSAVCTTCLK